MSRVIIFGHYLRFGRSLVSEGRDGVMILRSKFFCIGRVVC